MPFDEYIVGLAYLAGVLAGAGGAAWMALRHWYGDLRGAAALSAYGVLATAALLAVHIVPGMLGLLTREAVLAAAGLFPAATWLLARRRRPLEAVDTPETDRVPWRAQRASWLIAGAGITALSVYVIAFARDRRSATVDFVDALTFHLPQVAAWMHTDSMWQIDTFVPGWAFGNYPNNGDVLHLVAVLPWANDALVRFTDYPYLLLLGVCVYAAAAELRAPRPASVIFAALVVALPTVAVPAIDHAMTDPIMFATFAGGIVFLLRHARTGQRRELVLAGLGLGMALGTKWYGLSSAIVVVIVWAVASWRAGRAPVAVVRDGGLLTAFCALGGGVWMLRNLVLSGNPLFPQKVELAGLTIFDAPPDPIREQIGLPLSDYLDDPGTWEDVIVPALADAFGIGGLLLVCVALLALVFRRVDGRVRALAAGAVALLCVYVFTPYTALDLNGEPHLAGAAARYAIPALVLGAVIGAWLVGRTGRLGIVLEVVAVVLVVQAITLYDDFGSVSYFAIGSRRLATAVGAVVLLTGAAYAAAHWWPRRHAGGMRVLAAGLGALLAVGIVVAGDRQQAAFNDGRYHGADPALDALGQADTRQRVGLAGVWDGAGLSPPYPAFGPRLHNDVRFVGPWIRERLEHYDGERPFRAAVRRGDYDLMLLGLARAEPNNGREVDWVQAEGYEVVVRSPRLALARRVR